MARINWGFKVAVVLVLAVFLESFLFLEAHAEGSSKKKTVYPSKTKLDFDGAEIEGELRNPGDFYFQHRPEDKFNSLVKRRKNFHREMKRDVVLSK